MEEGRVCRDTRKARNSADDHPDLIRMSGWMGSSCLKSKIEQCATRATSKTLSCGRRVSLTARQEVDHRRFLAMRASMRAVSVSR